MWDAEFQCTNNNEKQITKSQIFQSLLRVIKSHFSPGRWYKCHTVPYGIFILQVIF